MPARANTFKGGAHVGKHASESRTRIGGTHFYALLIWSLVALVIVCSLIYGLAGGGTT